MASDTFYVLTRWTADDFMFRCFYTLEDAQKCCADARWKRVGDIWRFAGDDGCLWEIECRESQEEARRG